MEVSLKGLVIILGTGSDINEEFLIEDPDAYNQFVANDPSNTSSPNNAVDVVIATFNPDYTQNWGTLVGGIGGEEGRKMSVSEDNKLCITGYVNNPAGEEPHYPTEDPLPMDDTNYFEPASFANGNDAFISVFALDGVDIPTGVDDIY